MEVFLFIALVFVYVLTAFTVPGKIVKRVWILAFAAAFVITAVSILFISNGKQTVLMQESEMNWYYFLYLFGSMSVILGLINIWIYRKDLTKIFSSSDDDTDSEA